MTVSFSGSSFLSSGSAVATTGTALNGVSSADLYNNEVLDKKYNYNDTKEGYEIAYSGRDAAISTSISNITKYIENGEEDKVIQAYDELLNQMSTQERYSQLVSEEGDDTQLRSIARQLIESEIGCDLVDYIQDKTKSNKSSENQRLLWGDNCDTTTSEDLLKEMCNLDLEKGHSNLFQKGFFAFCGIFTKAYDAIFGDGKKH